MFGYINKILITNFKLLNKAFATVTRDSFGKSGRNEKSCSAIFC